MFFRLLHGRSGAVSDLLADLDAGDAVLIDPRGADVPLPAAIDIGARRATFTACGADPVDCDSMAP